MFIDLDNENDIDSLRFKYRDDQLIMVLLDKIQDLKLEIKNNVERSCKSSTAL